MVDRRPTFEAFVFAAPTALAVWITLLTSWVMLTDGPVRAASLMPYMVLGGVIFGVPILAGTLLLIALPTWLLLRTTIGIRASVVVIVGAACGVLIHFVVGGMWGEPEVSFVPIPVAIATGAITAWVWWRMWRRPTEPALRGRGTA